jgi:hypothetical protein
MYTDNNGITVTAAEEILFVGFLLGIGTARVFYINTIGTEIKQDFVTNCLCVMNYNEQISIVSSERC